MSIGNKGSDSIQVHWRENELPGINCLVHNSGVVTILNIYSVSSLGEKIYYAFPVADTTINSIEQYNDDVWTECQTHPSYITTNRLKIVCGEGGMGSEGFIAATDIENGELIWALFSTESNPFVRLELNGENVLAYSDFLSYKIQLNNLMVVYQLCRELEKEMKDKERDKAIVEELLFGEANRFAREPFEAGAQGQVLALQALQGLFAGLALPGRQAHLVGSPRIGQPLRHGPARRRQHGLQASKCGVGTPAKDEGHDLARGRVFDPPEPALLLLASHERPHLVGAQPQRGRRVGGVGRAHGGQAAHGLDFF